MKPADRRSFGSIRARLTAGFVFILAPCLLIAGAILPRLATHFAEISDRRRFEAIAGQIREQIARPDWRARLSGSRAVAAMRESHTAMLLADRNGTTIWRTPGLAPGGRSGPAEERQPAPGAPHSEGDEAARKEPDWLRRRGDDWYAVADFPVGPESRPMTLVFFRSTRAVLQERGAQKLGLLLHSLFALLVVAGGSWLLIGRTLSPIRRLALQAGAASAENLQVRLQAPSRDAEVVELVDTLNGLIGRLAETAAVKGRFYAAASHELRTPLQALSGHLEVSLSRGRTAQEYESFLNEASRQTARLTSLVKDLLLLHQLDSLPPAAGPELRAPLQEPVDLADVCAGALAQLAPLIEARGLRLTTDPAAGAEIMAIPTHAEILVRNLVENAVKYAAPGGEVTLSLGTSGGRGSARLELFNECPPLPEWDPRKLFEPFYRPDTARSARTGGNGLGLAICRAIAAANGWTITLRQETHGVRAIATFGTLGKEDLS